MTTTLVDVHSAIEEGQYRHATQQLQEVLKSNPSADAWYLAAQFTMEKDRDRAVRHLKRALLLNPGHRDTLTLLGQLGEGRDFTVGDVADELGDAVAEQVDQAPVLGKLNRLQQIVFVMIVSLVITLSFIWARNLLFPYQGPAYIPEQGPQAQQVVLLDATEVFNAIRSSDLTKYAIQYVSAAQTPGKRVMRFSVPGASGHLQPVQVVVYDSISSLIRDQATQRQWETIYTIVTSGNAMLLYSKELGGFAIEGQLLDLFDSIAGT